MNSKEQKKDTLLMPTGTPLGLCDSNGVEFQVGSMVKMTYCDNKEVHGGWVIYTITLQGTIPLLSYYSSEKGQVLPVGYTGTCLCHLYDQKMLVFSTDSMSLRPEEELLIIKK